MVSKIDAYLRNFSKVVLRDIGIKVIDKPGAGAAGGAGAGALAFFRASLKPGIQIVTQAAQLERKIKGADLVITGEGRIDGQTLFGKTPAGVAQAAGKQHVPVIAICGKIGPGAEKLHSRNIAAIFSISDGPMTYEYSLRHAAALIQNRAEQICRLLQIRV